MRFRFVLSHEIEGSLEISEPDGWKDCTLKLERHEEFHSLIEYFEGSFIFYGNNGIENGGIDFIKNIERNYGFDATIRIDIDLTYDEVNFSSVFNGQLLLSMAEHMPNNKMRLPIIRDDFWAKFIARKDTPVNIQSPVDLDGNPARVIAPAILNLTNQIIDAGYYATEDRGRYILMDEEYIQYIPPKVDLDEIEDVSTPLIATNTELPVWIFYAVYAGAIDIDIRIEYDKAVFVPNDGHENPRTIFDWWIQKNDEAPIEFSYVVNTYHDAAVYANWNIFDPGDDVVITAVATYVATWDLVKGDVIRVYLKRDSESDLNIAIWGTDGLHVAASGVESLAFSCDRATGMVEVPTYFRLKQHTVFPETTAEGFLIHDIAAAICERIIGPGSW